LPLPRIAPISSLGFLADYNYGSLRYYDDKGVKDIHRDTD
jgi:hypothetical protein